MDKRPSTIPPEPRSKPESTVTPSEIVQAAPSQSRNKTWIEQWGKEPTYPKFFIENEYLKSRRIRDEVLKEFGVGFYSNPKSKSTVNNHILFPIHIHVGELMAFAARTTENGGARYWFPPIEKFNRTLELWNVHRAIKEGKHVYVVEGFFGAMNLWQHGYRCVVVLMGSCLSEAQGGLLAREFETATFILDPDAAVQKLKRHVIETLLGRMPVRIIEPGKQVDEMTAEELNVIFQPKAA